MPKTSPEQKNARREEIIDACEMLYRTMSFKDITLKEIGQITSFTRTSIYNYFQTKEEIFLALLKREYELWIADLKSQMNHKASMSKEEFSSMLAHSLEKRPQFLKILSMNHYDMEANSRPEQLTAFKAVYGQSMQVVKSGLNKYFPKMSEVEKQTFIYTFFPFLFGVYPYTFVTQKQKEAMEKAEVNYVYFTIYDLTYHCVYQLLK